MRPFERLTDEQLGDVRVAMSNMMLETNGVTYAPTKEAIACQMAGSALNELTAYRRSGLSPEQVAEMKHRMEGLEK